MKNALIQPGILVNVTAIKNGEHAAFLSVFNTLHIKTFRFFFKKTQEVQPAKDLTQQTFIRLWQFRHTLSETHPLEKQVFVIAHSLLVNHFEKESNLQKWKEPQQGREALFVADRQSLFELSDHQGIAIDNLTAVRKEMLSGKAVQDVKDRDIVQQMDISVKTVEAHFNRAFRKMKQLMMLFLFLLAAFINGNGRI